MIKFTIIGSPVPKGRPRVALRGGYPVTYTPKKTETWENYMRFAAIQYRPEKLLEGPLSIKLHFVLIKPKSVPKKRKYPCVKPDIDNLEKSVLDALEGLFYRNDSQIVRKVASKDYGEPARVEVELEVKSGTEDGQVKIPI